MEDKSKTKVEFSVDVSCTSCEEKLNRTLTDLKGVKVSEFSLADQKLILEISEQSRHSIEEIRDLIETKAGIRTVIKGVGVNQIAAVSEVHGKQGSKVIGVVRLSQLLNKKCFVDGVIDGLKDFKTAVNIHEYGDLTGNNFENVGPIFVPIASEVESVNGRSSFRLTISNCDLSTCIGRSLVVSEKEKDPIAAGIVARASTIGGNVKKICVCSGKTLWEERKDKSKINNGGNSDI